MLRPEFVQSWQKPLSSDAFSASIGEVNDRDANDVDVVHAGQNLINRVIPNITQKLDLLEIHPYDRFVFGVVFVMFFGIL